MNHNMTLLSGAMPVTVELESLHKINLVLLLKLIDHIGAYCRKHNIEIGLNSRVVIEQLANNFRVQIKALDLMPQTHVVHFDFDREKLTCSQVSEQLTRPATLFAFQGAIVYTLNPQKELLRLRGYADMMVNVMFDGSYLVTKNESGNLDDVATIVGLYEKKQLKELPDFPPHTPHAEFLERIKEFAKA